MLPTSFPETRNAGVCSSQMPESFNPWTTLYQPKLDFKVGWDFRTDVYTVTNRAPKPSEPARYEYHRGAPASKAMTLIAFVDNLQGHGHNLRRLELFHQRAPLEAGHRCRDRSGWIAAKLRSPAQQQVCPRRSQQHANVDRACALKQSAMLIVGMKFHLGR